jgi:hypothetical protein
VRIPELNSTTCILSLSIIGSHRGMVCYITHVFFTGITSSSSSSAHTCRESEFSVPSPGSASEPVRIGFLPPLPSPLFPFPLPAEGQNR